MTNAARDNNFVPGKLACLNTDTVQGTNLVRICIDETTGGICIDETATLHFTMRSIDPRDQNYVTCWMFEGTDGLTYPAVATSDGKLLIDLV